MQHVFIHTHKADTNPPRTALNSWPIKYTDLITATRYCRLQAKSYCKRISRIYVRTYWKTKMKMMIAKFFLFKSTPRGKYWFTNSYINFHYMNSYVSHDSCSVLGHFKANMISNDFLFEAPTSRPIEPRQVSGHCWRVAIWAHTERVWCQTQIYYIWCQHCY